VPGSKIQIFDMGEKAGEFTTKVSLLSKDALQIRNNALESARIVINRYLIKKVGKTGYHFKVKVYPHHVMREHALATGAGADRFSTGMQKAYGKSIGTAAQVRAGQELMYVRVNGENIIKATESLRKASKKLPCRTIVVVKQL